MRRYTWACLGVAVLLVVGGVIGQHERSPTRAPTLSTAPAKTREAPPLPEQERGFIASIAQGGRANQSTTGWMIVTPG